jgi:MOSC domain-containing protein YiiM
VPSLVSVNLARATRHVPYNDVATGIGKLAVGEPVEIREPGPKTGGLGSGLVGDVIGDQRHHGGTDQAVYAYARERLDEWEHRLGRTLVNGAFGENFTTSGLDVDGALLGERWQIGRSVVLQVTEPRIPCATFRGWMGEPGWLRQFTDVGCPGAYLKVIAPGEVVAGDTIEIVHRPDHAVTIALAFRALVRQPSLLPLLRAAGSDLTDELRSAVESGLAFPLDL